MTSPPDIQRQTFSVFNRARAAAEVARAVDPMHRDGFVMLPAMPREFAVEIAGWLGAHTPVVEGALAHYQTEHLLACEPLKLLCRSAAVLMRAAAWLGVHPVLTDVAAWKSEGPAQGAPHTEDGTWRWHRDYDDWRACKLFLLLSDVGPDDGPHQFLAGSHREDWWREQGLVPDGYFVGDGRHMDVSGLPGVELRGPAGTMWMAATWAFHRGTAPKPGHSRVIFQACYTMQELEGSKGAMIKEAWG